MPALSLAPQAPLPLHTRYEMTLTPNGVYVLAPKQQVQAYTFQPVAEWPVLSELRVFWPWPTLRLLFEIEDRARKAEARRVALRKRVATAHVGKSPSALVRLGMQVVGADDDGGEDLSQPIVPVFPPFAEPLMIAWLARLRERGLAEEPIRIEYGPWSCLRGHAYHVRLVGAWTHISRTDLEETHRGSLVTEAEAEAVATKICMRLSRLGRRPVVVSQETV